MSSKTTGVLRMRMAITIRSTPSDRLSKRSLKLVWMCVIYSELGIFVPEQVFRDLVIYNTPQTIITKVFTHKMKNDAFIGDIRSSIHNNEVTLSEVETILENFGSSTRLYYSKEFQTH